MAGTPWSNLQTLVTHARTPWVYTILLADVNAFPQGQAFDHRVPAPPQPVGQPMVSIRWAAGEGDYSTAWSRPSAVRVIY